MINIQNKYGTNVRQDVALSTIGRGVPGYYPKLLHLAKRKIKKND